ncbi:MAG: PIN domain-containing protein [Pseudomonadota bacterium]
MSEAGYLLDTMVVSTFAKRRPDEAVRAWVSLTPSRQQYVSVITGGGIVPGICLLEESRRRRELEAWFANLPKVFEDRVLALDVEAARIWGRNLASMQRRGLSLATADLKIAAIAIRSGLTAVTRNERDLRRAGAKVMNPWT